MTFTRSILAIALVALAQNAPSQTENLHLPEDRTVVMSGEVPV